VLFCENYDVHDFVGLFQSISFCFCPTQFGHYYFCQLQSSRICEAIIAGFSKIEMYLNESL